MVVIRDDLYIMGEATSGLILNRVLNMILKRCFLTCRRNDLYRYLIKAAIPF